MSQINFSGSVGVPGSAWILGALNLVISGDHTMTPAEFSNKFIQVTSSVSLSITHNIVGPSNQGQEYTIQNKTTGGQSIQIIAATGTGVTIVNGQTINVVFDGTNYMIAGGTGAPDANLVTYTPSDSSDWSPTPSDVGSALNQLSARGQGTIEGLVFRPGGTAVGNVYINESALATATQSFNGAPYTIFFDLSLVSGTYTFASGFFNFAPNGTWTDDGYGYVIDFHNTTKLTNPPFNITGTLYTIINQSVDVCTLSNSLNIFTISDNASLISYSTGAFINDNGKALNIILKDSGSTASGVCFKITGGGSSVQLEGSSSLGSGNTISAGTININSASATIDSSYYSFSSLFIATLFVDKHNLAIQNISAASNVGKYILQNGTLYFSNNTWVSTSSSSTTPSIVFQPSGTAGGNIYTTETSLATATQSFNGSPYEIFFDFSFVSGSYTFEANNAYLDLAPGGIWTDNGLQYDLTFANNTVLTNLPAEIKGKLYIIITQTTDVCSPTAQTITKFSEYCTINCSNASFLNGGIVSTNYVIVKDSATLYNTGTFTCLGCYVAVYDGGYLNANAIDSSSYLYVFSSGASIDPTLFASIALAGSPDLPLNLTDIAGTATGIIPASYGIGSTIVDGSTGQIYVSNGSAWVASGGGSVDASVVTYEPGTPGNWSIVPTQVAQALDELSEYSSVKNSVFIYNPGFSPGGNVYNTFTDLVAATTGLDYATVIMWQGPESGTFTLPTLWEMICYQSMTLSDGVQITPPPYKITGIGQTNNSISILGESTSQPIFGRVSNIVLDNISLTTSSYPMFEVGGDNLHIATGYMTLLNNSSVGNASGSTPVITNPLPAGHFTINAYQRSIITANALGGSNYVTYYDAGSVISTTQTNASTFTSTGLSDPPFVVFFNSTGTEAQNVYTSWTDLVAAIANYQYVEIHTSTGGEIPAGTYTMPTAWSIVFDQSADITIDDGVSFSTTPTSILAPEGGAILSNCVSGSPFPNSSGNITINNMQFAFTGSGTPSPVFTYPSSTYPDMFWINSGSDGVLPVFSTTTGTLLCSGSEGYLPANTIALTGGWALYPDPGFGSVSSSPIDTSYYSRIIICGLYIDKTGLGITTIPASNGLTQSLLMDNTTGILYYSNGSAWTPLTGGGASYTPGEPSRWSGSPTTMQQAIDRIAAVVGASTPIP